VTQLHHQFITDIFKQQRIIIFSPLLLLQIIQWLVVHAAIYQHTGFTATIQVGFGGGSG